jgi:hypothetical protein
MDRRDRRYLKRLAVNINIKVYRLDKKTKHTVSAYLLDTKNMTISRSLSAPDFALSLGFQAVIRLLSLMLKSPGGPNRHSRDIIRAWAYLLSASGEAIVRDCGIFCAPDYVITGTLSSSRKCIYSLRRWRPGYMSWKGLICRRNTSERLLSTPSPK